MHLLLINVGGKTEIRIPQGLLYLASAVQAAGHAVTIHDEALAANPHQSLEKILAYDADIIGLSVYTLPWQLKRVEDISRAVKTARKSALVMWGGWHPTLYYRHSILNENVDIVVRGPGEKPVCELLAAVDEGRSLRNIPSLVIKENGEIIETGPECLAPQYLFPPLNFQLIDLNTYLRQHDRGAGILQYITSRGCHARCRFCVMSQLFKGHLIRKPRNQISSEIQNLLQNYKITAIHFSDDNTFRNDTEALELCDIIRLVTHGKNIPWRCVTRIDTLSRLSNGTYEKLVASGCKGVVTGIESGVDRVLQLMRKCTTVSQIHKAFKAMADNGLHMNLFSFLFGFTGETKKEANKTLALARKTRVKFPHSDITLHVYFPGASDACWLPSEVPQSLTSRLSEIFAKYYAKHITNYRLVGIHIRILRYYFGASKRREGDSAGRARSLRSMYQKLVLLRIKYGIFALPFEYYLSNFFMKNIKKCLGGLKSKAAKFIGKMRTIETISPSE